MNTLLNLHLTICWLVNLYQEQFTFTFGQEESTFSLDFIRAASLINKHIIKTRSLIYSIDRLIPHSFVLRIIIESEGENRN